jgi:cellulose synthase operon protein C
MPGPALTERDQAILRSFAGRIDPSDAGAHNNLGVLYYQKGLVPEAISAFARALELDPRMQVAQDNLDLAWRESGHLDARIAELQERLRRNPDDRDARWELGRAWASLGQHDRLGWPRRPAGTWRRRAAASPWRRNWSRRAR